MKLPRNFLLLMILAGLGLVYRVILANFCEKNIIWDMESYHKMALGFVSGQMVADCCMKNVGYGVFLGYIYKFFGQSNYLAFMIIQAVIDVLVAVVVYLISKNIHNGRVAIITYIVYLFNPYTSAFVGIKLAEIVTLLLISLHVYLLSTKTFFQNKISWFIGGSLLGLLLFTRQQFQYFVLVLIFVLVIIFKKNLKQKILMLFISLAGFLIFSSYTLVANYLTFGKISLGIPYSSTYLNLYMNFYNDLRYPELAVNLPNVHPEFTAISIERHDILLQDKIQYEEKYKKIFLDRIKYDWPLFLTNYFRNIFWIWDKYYLFIYTDIFYPNDTLILRIINTCLIFLAGIGIFKYTLLNKLKVFNNAVFVYSILLFMYITFFFPLVSNESRHSIAAYPLLIIWAGFGIPKI